MSAFSQLFVLVHECNPGTKKYDNVIKQII